MLWRECFTLPRLFLWSVVWKLHHAWQLYSAHQLITDVPPRKSSTTICPTLSLHSKGMKDSWRQWYHREGKCELPRRKWDFFNSLLNHGVQQRVASCIHKTYLYELGHLVPHFLSLQLPECSHSALWRVLAIQCELPLQLTNAFLYQKKKRKKVWAVYHSGSAPCSTHRLASIYICHCPWWVSHSPVISTILRSPLRLRLSLHQWLLLPFLQGLKPGHTIPGFSVPLRCPQSYSFCDFKTNTMWLTITHCQVLLPAWDVILAL